MLYRALLLVALLTTAAGCRREDPDVVAARDSVKAAEAARAHTPETEATLNATAVRNESANIEASPVSIEVGNLATLARGEVRNGSADTLDRIVVEFDIIGGDGKVVRQDSFNVYNVAPGGSAEYQLKLEAEEDSARVRAVRGNG